jgi:N-acetylmuramoyl-L-alanine amidase/putative methionine-R-sulfoxide reductase with GAF domain
MATITTKPDFEVMAPFKGAGMPAWPRDQDETTDPNGLIESPDDSAQPSQRDALQALLAFSALHEQVRRRKAMAAHHRGFDAVGPAEEFEVEEQFVLDEVLQLVAERAIAITGADGLAIALAEGNEIVLRAAAGTVRPDVGARIDRDSAFSGACFRSAKIVRCDDTETDPRVNLQACRKLGARSMIAVPLCGRRRVIGLLEAFSAWPFSFNESDIRNLSLLAELVLGALRPEDEDRFAESAQVAAKKLEPAASVPAAATARDIPVQAAPVEAPAPVVVAPAAATPVAVAPVAAAPVVAPVVITRAAEAVVASAVATEILDNPAPEAAKVTELESSAVTETAAEPALTFGQSEAAAQRPWMLVLLVCIVVATAFAGGVWWKLKTAQLGSAMVSTQKIAPEAGVPAKTTPSGPSSVTEQANSAAANLNADAASDVDDQSTSVATPQELTKFPRVTGIRHWTSADSSTVVLDLEDQVQYEAHRLAGPDRIYFDLHDTQLAPELTAKLIDVGDAMLNRIRVAQPVAGMTRIVLETKANSNFSVSLESNPYRLVVEVHKVGAAPKAAVNLFPNAEAEKNKLAIVIPPPSKEDLQMRARVPKMRIVVDAGHGGWDLGTVGKRGLLEKDLVFEISQRLGKLLESRLGADVIYTRPDDNYITLDERASIANQAQADLFVSVHANYSDLPSARGVETYYTNFFSAPGAKDVDTHATAGAVKSTATPTLTPADLHERIEQSRRLAASVQRSLYGTLSVQNPGLRDRGIKEAGFVVLTESAMPGILAEVSFVSSPTDEQKLRSDGYREQIAEALYKGIARYAVAAKGVKLASAGK